MITPPFSLSHQIRLNPTTLIASHRSLDHWIKSMPAFLKNRLNTTTAIWTFLYKARSYLPTATPHHKLSPTPFYRSPVLPASRWSSSFSPSSSCAAFCRSLLHFRPTKLLSSHFLKTRQIRLWTMLRKQSRTAWVTPYTIAPTAINLWLSLKGGWVTHEYRKSFVHTLLNNSAD